MQRERAESVGLEIDSGRDEGGNGLMDLEGTPTLTDQSELVLWLFVMYRALTLESCIFTASTRN